MSADNNWIPVAGSAIGALTGGIPGAIIGGVLGAIVKEFICPRCNHIMSNREDAYFCKNCNYYIKKK